MTSAHAKELFFPYYINQSRLLDLYAILNGGYSEYEEISTSSEAGKKRSGNGKLEAGGFRLFKIGASLSGSTEHSSGESCSSSMKIVQTTTSMLSIVASTLAERGYIHEIEDAESGSFVIVPVILKINSIKSLINEARELIELSEKMASLNRKSPAKAKNESLVQITKIDNIVRELFGAEEIVFETEEYALVGTISDDCLYQAVRADIIGTELKCLAQVKRVFPEGTRLLKNTVFTKIKDASSKKALIDSLESLVKDSNFEYECDAILEIVGKPVYQLEIIALYQPSIPVGHKVSDCS